MGVAYRKRQNLFEATETEWRAEDDALIVTDASGKVIRLPWQEVAGIRLAYAPTRAKTWRYVFVLHFRNGRKIDIDNAHFAGIGNFEDRSETYVPFVRAALARIRALAPEARARAGSATMSYVLNLGFVVLSFGLLAFVLFTLPTPLDYLSGSSFIKLGIVIILVPVLFRWVVKARPRGIRLDALPKDALPNIA
jgi:hypothetical protein